MTAHSEHMSDLCGILTDLIDGEPSREQLTALEHLLSETPGALAYYRDYIRICAMLEFQRSATPNPVGSQAGDLATTCEAFSQPASCLLQGSSPVIVNCGNSHDALGFWGSGWPAAYLVATVVLMVGIVVGSVPRVSHHVGPAGQSRSIAAASRRTEANVQYVGHISSMIDCTFERAAEFGKPDSAFASSISPIPNSQALVTLGQQFVLSSGLMEITYDTGAKVLLQGPAAYKVESADGGFLAVGKLTARVDRKPSSAKVAVGRESSDASPVSRASSALFCVRTPTVLVTDLGTEFGVAVSEEGNTSSHVFQGAVEVQVFGAQDGPSERIRLSEDQAVRVTRHGSDKPVVVLKRSADATSFIRSHQLPRIAEEQRMKPFRRWQAYGEELRRDPSLVAYYDFQRRADSPHVLHAGMNGMPSGVANGTIVGAKWTTGFIEGKHALAFETAEDGVQVNLPRQVDDLTLAAWVNVKWLGDNDFCALLASENWSRQGQVHWNVSCEDGSLELSICGWPLPHFKSQPIFDDAARFYRWTHVAEVYDHASMSAKLYIDGQVMKESKIQRHVPISIGPAWIGHWNVGPSRNLHGRIAELVILGRVLNREEIVRLYQAGGAVSAANASVSASKP